MDEVKTVRVDECYITAGMPGSPKCCAIALAVKDALYLPVGAVTVGPYYIRAYYWQTNQVKVFVTPPKARRFIIDFDAGLPVEAFDLELRPPAATL